MIMEKSNSIKNIASALITFNVKIGKIKKDANNPFFKSKYASLSNILENIKDPLTESGLSFVQFPTGEHGLTTLLMHGESGEFIQSTYEMKPVKSDPQGIGSAITYQRRYALSAILGLDIDDDDDANAASKQPQQPTIIKQEAPKAKATDKAVNQAAERILQGETELVNKMKDSFNLTEKQSKVLDVALENYSKTNKAA